MCYLSEGRFAHAISTSRKSGRVNFRDTQNGEEWKGREAARLISTLSPLTYAIGNFSSPQIPHVGILPARFRSAISGCTDFSSSASIYFPKWRSLLFNTELLPRKRKKDEVLRCLLCSDTFVSGRKYRHSSCSTSRLVSRSFVLSLRIKAWSDHVDLHVSNIAD